MTNLKSNTLMGENLKKLQHHQWGTITGYANECILAVLQDELEVLKKQIEPHDTGHIHTTISTLSHRIEGLTKETTEEDRKDAVASLLNVTRNPDDEEKYDYPTEAQTYKEEREQQKKQLKKKNVNG